MVPLCLSPRIRARLAGWPWSGRTRFSPPHPATVSPMLRSSQRMSARIRSDRVIMGLECEEWGLVRYCRGPPEERAGVTLRTARIRAGSGSHGDAKGLCRAGVAPAIGGAPVVLELHRDLRRALSASWSVGKGSAWRDRGRYREE